MYMNPSSQTVKMWIKQLQGQSPVVTIGGGQSGPGACQGDWSVPQTHRLLRCSGFCQHAQG